MAETLRLNDRTGTGSSDNYAYLVIDEKSKDAVIIDPAHPEEVAPVLRSKTAAGEINLTGIVNTHHHWDHASGNKEMVSCVSGCCMIGDALNCNPQLGHFNGLPITGGKDCQGVTKTPSNGETFKIGQSITVRALHTPCHTQDSICYFVEDGSDRAVFTGDTLFIGGCGRFFEGTPAEMHTALNKTLAALPDDTKVYPGHEYTKQNVKFAASVLPSEAIKKLQAFAETNQETQGKFTIGQEKLHNVFMRLDDPTIQKATGKTDPVDVMGALREMKNGFK
ncbi:MAG: Cytoplasmic glyoxalase II [Caeruleum heppii]|nr:MAG: Cytoplasmic glyoxalase II [Caeruleum heppii]